MFVNYKPKLFVSIFDNKQTNKQKRTLKKQANKQNSFSVQFFSPYHSRGASFSLPPFCIYIKHIPLPYTFLLIVQEIIINLIIIINFL